MSSDPSSRRDFLLRFAVFGTSAFGAAGLLSACGGDAERTADAGGACSDVSALTPAEVQRRQALNYVEETPIPGKRCDKCKFWQAPTGDASGASAFCGGCTLVKGPINPGGYCTSWVAAA